MKFFVCFLIFIFLKSIKSYEWQKVDQNSTILPKNSVIGAENNKDGHNLYIIRKIINDKIFYGDIVGGNLKDAFVVDIDINEDISVSNPEVLIAKNYVWCKLDSQNFNPELPICRAMHDGILLTGTLLSNGSCKLVYSTAPIKIDEIEILILNKSSCHE
ncbi:hypothetical protein PVAND_000112 [Polypedilum vanderplanki]|uniref:Uncharacterized protein n=1 Tax=Polypedilum vanderplanki TaxID=319348 RepID=A0A9J6BJV1_POLVA|nr:hypothetical protein PVAND_000112 [Polypedilum vanderplanki]